MSKVDLTDHWNRIEAILDRSDVVCVPREQCIDVAFRTDFKAIERVFDEVRQMVDAIEDDGQEVEMIGWGPDETGPGYWPAGYTPDWP